VKYHGPKDRLDAARSTKTPTEELSRLAASDHNFVREAVASNPNTPPSTLMEMLPQGLPSDDAWRMLLALLKNPKLPQALGADVAKQVIAWCGNVMPRDFYPRLVLDTLSTCSQVPLESILGLADPNAVPTHLRGRIARHGCKAPLLELLASDPSQRVARRAQRALCESDPVGDDEATQAIDPDA